MPPDSPIVRNLQPVLETDDRVYYPVSDEMGETSEHYWAAHELVALLADYVRRNRVPAVVGSDQFFYFKRGDPRAVVCPDLYIIDDEPNDLKIDSWKLWEHGGKAPTLVLEIVSDEYAKDYADHLITRYEQLGARELIRFDPQHGRNPRRKLLSQFIRDDAGRLLEQPTEPGRIRSKFHDLWFVHQPDNTLRIAHGPNAATLWPTAAEREATDAEARARAEARVLAEAEARAAETRARVEAETRAAEATARAEAAEAELARLRNRT